MAKDPAMPFYVNDWLSSPRTACMTLEQQGAYLRLLCYCWASQEAAIPDEEQALARLSGLAEGWFTNGSRLVRDCFVAHPSKPGYLTNKRLLELWSERVEWREKSASAGRKSGESRRKSSNDKQNGNEPPFENGSPLVRTKPEPNANSSSSSSSSSSKVKTEENPLTPFPPELDTEAFRVAWAEWLSERKDKRIKPYTDRGARTQLKRLAAFGSSVAVAAIEASIRNGWQGLFPEKVPADVPVSKNGRPTTKGEAFDQYAKRMAPTSGGGESGF